METKVWFIWRRPEMQLVYLTFFYLLGSIPVAWLMGKLAGRGDIRRLGSGNAGVMNVALNVSRWAGLIVFLAEIAKGVATVLLAQSWQLSEAMTGLAVLAAVVGTRWSIWLRGSGGRANTLGVAALLVLSWPAVAIGVAIWVAARVLTKSSFWATRCWLLSLPVSLGLATMSWWYAGLGAVLAVFYLSEHKTGTDDHTILKETWPSLWAFLTAPRRRWQDRRDEKQGSVIQTDFRSE
jgi:glycerol-3-phosphate acyltransferase PlsY